ncbi:hypothetical protein V1478_005744 [Vespula squamosa]|uniref:Uncharacterized protein n=1 Tax=Vespula squamosa TaxID=30214 RepID=A0ABD2B9N9_VESSQ
MSRLEMKGYIFLIIRISEERDKHEKESTGFLKLTTMLNEKIHIHKSGKEGKKVYQNEKKRKNELLPTISHEIIF